MLTPSVSQPGRAGRGFTLIEMLVVMFVIGIMSSMVMLTINIGNPNDAQSQLNKQVERLLQLSSLAADQAVLTGEPIGLLILPPDEEPGWQYNWFRHRGGQWVSTEEPLTGGQLPREVEVTLEIEGQLVDFTRLQARDSDEPPVPNIVFYPGGEVTPFLLTLVNAQSLDDQVLVTSERIGEVEQISDQEALELL